MNAPMTKAEALATKHVGALTKICRSELAKGWENIPPELAELRGWLLWKWETGAKKATKVPYYAKVKVKRSGQQGSPGDRAQLCTLAEAVEELKKPGGYDFAGVGLAMLADWNLTALDFDHVIEGEKVAPWVSELIDVDVTYGEASPSDTGARVFYRGLMPPALRDKKHKEGDTGFETFCTQGFVTVTGKELGMFSVLGTPLPALPESVVTFAENRFQRARTDSGALTFDPDCPFSSSSSSDRHADVDLEGLRWMLNQLGADFYDPYDNWRDVGFCVHHQFHGEDEEADAFDAWNDWSSQSLSYVPEHVEKIWEDAKAERTGGIKTVGTLKRWVGIEKWRAYLAERKAAASAAVVVAQDWAARIGTADAVALKGAIAAEIRAAELSEIDREILVSHIKRRLTALEGAAPGVAAVRKLLTPPKVRIETDGIELGDALSLAPAWAQPWVWDGSADCYVHRVTKETRTIVSFNAAFSRHAADLFLGDEKPVTPHEAMTCHWRVPVVSGQMYYPPASGDIFTFEGRSYLNAYRADLRVEPDAKVTDAGRQLRKALERQFELLIPDMRERALLRYWLAHNYLHPGRKIRWAPVIKGCEGDGKTTVLSLLMPVLGGKNAQILNGGTVLGSAFTGWAEGSAVTIVEEIRFQGENKYEVANRMKPYITNDCVEVRALYKDQRVVLNTTNYGFTTNHVDMLPINDADRRYFILHSPFEKKEEVEAALRSRYGIPMEEHFAELNDLPSAHPGQLALWLAESEAPAEFKANGTAPVTAAREVTILASHENDLDDQVRRILEAGADGVHDYEAKVALDAWKLAPDREDLRKEAERACSLAGWPPLPAATDGAGWAVFERERSARGTANLRLGVGPDAVAFDLLKDELNSLRKAPTGRQVREALHAAGFVPLPSAQSRGPRAKQVKWNGSRYSVWVRPHLIDVDDARARAELSRTTPDPFD
jgi:hypothetical protein